MKIILFNNNNNKKIYLEKSRVHVPCTCKEARSANSHVLYHVIRAFKVDIVHVLGINSTLTRDTGNT